MDNINDQQKDTVHCHLVSDFNADILAGYLSNDTDEPAVQTIETSFGPIIPKLIEYNQHKTDLITNNDYLIIWTRPEAVSLSFRKALDFEPFQINDVLAEVDQFCSYIKNIAGQFKAVLIPSWVIPPYRSLSGLLDYDFNQGTAFTLAAMNMRLVKNLSDCNNIFVLNAQRWIEYTGSKKAYIPKFYYMAKVAFGHEVFSEAVKDIKSAIHGISGKARKLIIVDLDDTLWSGIVGDLGWENIRLGGHDAIGEAFVDFQYALKQLKNRGVLLAIVSKNEEKIALEAIQKHPEMILKIDDFIAWRINWKDKAQNISDLASEVNLGLQSIVFLDDSPYERNRVRDALPEVFVPELPADKTLLSSTLLNLRCFNSPRISSEDKERTSMYLQENQRKKSQQKFGSLDDWLKNMDIMVHIEELNDGNLQRTAQLFNKTNQMNLSTRRMPEHHLTQWLEQGRRNLWTLRVSDRYGDSGLTGILSVEVNGEKLTLVDFILSCRVFGRGIEKTMLYLISEYARYMNCGQISAIYLPTEKNKPCLDALRESDFDEIDSGNQIEFTATAERLFPLPEYIRLLPANLHDLFSSAKNASL